MSGLVSVLFVAILITLFLQKKTSPLFVCTYKYFGISECGGGGLVGLAYCRGVGICDTFMWVLEGEME